MPTVQSTDTAVYHGMAKTRNKKFYIHQQTIKRIADMAQINTDFHFAVKEIGIVLWLEGPEYTRSNGRYKDAFIKVWQ